MFLPANGNCVLLVVQQFLHSTRTREEHDNHAALTNVVWVPKCEQRIVPEQDWGLPTQSDVSEKPVGEPTIGIIQTWDKLKQGLHMSSCWDVMATELILVHKYHITANIIQHGERKLTICYLEGLGITAEAALVQTLIMEEAQHTLFCLFHGYQYYWSKPQKQKEVCA